MQRNLHGLHHECPGADGAHSATYMEYTGSAPGRTGHIPGPPVKLRLFSDGILESKEAYSNCFLGLKLKLGASTFIIYHCPAYTINLEKY